MSNRIMLPKFSILLSAAALVISGLSIYLTFSPPQVKYKSERDFVLEALVDYIEEQQAAFTGTITDEGCYVLEDGGIQTLIRQFGFTSEELGQSVEDLVCHGFLVPLDYSSERDA